MAEEYYTSRGWMVAKLKIEVPTIELTNWSPERIASFFAGIAQAEEAIHGVVQVAELEATSLAEIDELPSDLADAYESFKLAIGRHRLAGWSEVSRGTVVAVLTMLSGMTYADEGQP